jgi:hypothetical protein
MRREFIAGLGAAYPYNGVGQHEHPDSPRGQNRRRTLMAWCCDVAGSWCDVTCLVWRLKLTRVGAIAGGDSDAIK